MHGSLMTVSTLMLLTQGGCIPAVDQAPESPDTHPENLAATDADTAVIVDDGAQGHDAVAPIAHWSFDDCDPTVASIKDDSGNDHDVILQTGVACAEGLYGAALRLDGSAYAFANSLSLKEGSYTITGWFQPGPFTANTTTIVGSYGFGIQYNASGDYLAARVARKNVSGWVYPTGLFVDDEGLGNRLVGTWAHYAATIDGAHVEIFLDGQSVAAASQSDDPLFPPYEPDQVQLGYLATGLLDDVRIYDRALNALELEDVIVLRPYL